MNFPVEIKIIDTSAPDYFEGARIVSSEKCGCFLCESGDVTLRTPTGTITVNPGDLFFYAPASIIHIESLSNETSGILASFDVEASLAQIRSAIQVPGMLQMRLHPMFHLEASDFESVKQDLLDLANDIETLTDDQSTTGRLEREMLTLRCQLMTFRLLKFYFRENPEDPRLSSQNRTVVFEDFLLNAHHYYTTHREVAFYAGLANLSVKYFSNVIKQVSGFTPGTMIEHLLLGQAKRLLEDRKLSIKEIAGELNFSSQSAFGKFFKKQTGISPYAYRLRRI